LFIAHCIAAIVEEGIQREQSRGNNIEQEWAALRETVNAIVVVNGNEDVVNLRRDILSMK